MIQAFTKEMQLSKKRTKKKPSMKNKKKITDDEKEFLEWAKEQDLSCFACGTKNGIELHHVKKSSVYAKNHKRVIPLCGIEHHRLGKYAVHTNKKWFFDKFPLEMQERFADSLYEDFIGSKE